MSKRRQRRGIRLAEFLPCREVGLEPDRRGVLGQQQRDQVVDRDNRAHTGYERQAEVRRIEQIDAQPGRGQR